MIKIALLILDWFHDDVMRATAFDQIYVIIADYPMEQITPEILCAQLLNSKKLKITNRILNELRDEVRPGVIAKL